jgi:glycerophosphoryl diester phosphodiesterase
MCRVEMIAHRGASYDAPENTLSAVRLAWEQGADAVEIDCRLTADGQIVVIHDPDTRRTAKESLQVHMHSLQDLQQLDVGRWKELAFCREPIPTLTDVIRTMPTGGRLFIEVKCGVEIVTTLADLLGRAEKPVDRFVVISYDRQVVAKMKQRLAEVTALLVCRCEPAGARSGTAAAIEDLIEIARCDRLDGLDLDARGLLDATTTAALTATGLSCFSWTVDDPARARQLITAGVQGISTNRPGWLRDQLRGQPPSPEVG